MAESRFKIGDGVRLKKPAGSPDMMVTMISPDSGGDAIYLQCIWRDANSNPQKESYPEDALESVEEAKEREKRQMEDYEKGLPDQAT